MNIFILNIYINKKNMNIQKIGLLLFGIVLVLFFVFKKTDHSPDLASSEIVIKGSDTEVQLVSNLAEQFGLNNPDVSVSVTGGGSTVGIAAILNGEIGLANSSRPLKSDEITAFKEKGIDLKTLVIARDGLSLIVHPQNPIRELTLAQVGQIFKGEITDWSEVSSYSGLISLYGRQSTSGTYGFFRDVALQADYAPSMKNMEGSQAIFDGVSQDQMGIGYVGIGYVVDDQGRVRDGIRPLSIASQSGSVAVSPLDEASVREGKYPLFRPIFQFLRADVLTSEPLRKFLQFEVSPSGQELVKKSGFYTITSEDEATNAWLK